MRSLIWIFAGRTHPKVHFRRYGSYILDPVDSVVFSSLCLILFSLFYDSTTWYWTRCVEQKTTCLHIKQCKPGPNCAPCLVWSGKLHLVNTAVWSLKIHSADRRDSDQTLRAGLAGVIAVRMSKNVGFSTDRIVLIYFQINMRRRKYMTGCLLQRASKRKGLLTRKLWIRTKPWEFLNGFIWRHSGTIHWIWLKGMCESVLLSWCKKWNCDNTLQ